MRENEDPLWREKYIASAKEEIVAAEQLIECEDFKRLDEAESKMLQNALYRKYLIHRHYFINREEKLHELVDGVMESKNKGDIANIFLHSLSHSPSDIRSRINFIKEEIEEKEKELREGIND